ncbi:integrase family protein [Acinetobacter sp.]|uniref:integrase family protein n=1 Tax=Acinetobacter sp. TaxID=472 RepID=UPI002586F870|nr:integrase family protein [Acinetobacter sp.]
MMSYTRYNITKTFVDSLPFSPSKITFYKDEKLIGFAVRVTKNSKSYIAEKKLPDGRTCRVTIGTHGIWTVSQAREKAQEYLLMISKGIDPNAEKTKSKNIIRNQIIVNTLIPTLSEAYDNYKSKKNLSKATLEAYDRCVNDYFSDWKNIKITELSQKMVIDRHMDLSKRSLAQANLSMKFLSAVYNFTASILFDDNDQKIITEKSPVGVIYKEKKWNKIKRRKGYIRSDQLHDWSEGVCKTYWKGNQGTDPRAYTNQDYLLLLILTGFRREEGETLEWKNIDLKYGTIKITDTKNHEDLLLPMGDMLWHIMRERKKFADNNKYVFPGMGVDTHITDKRNAREEVTKNTGIEFTFHDLRRTFGTIANSLAIGSYTIKKLINHSLDDDDLDVTDGYIQVTFDDLRNAMNLIENKVLSHTSKKLIKNRLYIQPKSTRNAFEDWHRHTELLINSDS